MQIPDFAREGGGSTQRENAVTCASKFTVTRLAPNVWEYALNIVNVVPKGEKTPTLPMYLRFLQREIEQRRVAAEDPSDGDWQGLVLSLPVALHLQVLASITLIGSTQGDLFDDADDTDGPFITELPIRVGACKVHVSGGVITITHRVSFRCATDMRPLLGCDVLLQWVPGPVSGDSEGSNVDEDDDDTLPAEL